MSFQREFPRSSLFPRSGGCPPRITRRELLKLSGSAAAAFLLLPGCGGGDSGPGGAADAGFYLGRVAFQNELIGISLTDTGAVRILVTDAEPGGDAEWFEGQIEGPDLDLVSASGRARLRVTFNPDHHYFSGDIEFPNGLTHAVAAGRGEYGADLYDFEVSGGHYQGASALGHAIDARQEGDFVVGTIRRQDGTLFPFRVMDLSRAFGYSTPGGVDGRYTVIVSGRGLHYGRGGDVRGGNPDASLIALNIGSSPSPTPGFYFGKIAFERDVIGIKIDQPDPAAGRRIRAYVSDSEPDGDVEWFVGSLSGNSAADLVSASGNARMDAALVGDQVSGTLTLPGGRTRRFFALAAGEGAGIYDVVVHPDGTIAGESEEGGRLEATQDGPMVRITLTPPGGSAPIQSTRYDLTRALRYTIPGNSPDTYLAIIGPHASYVFGRTGLVKQGSPGLRIIGLNMDCY